MRTLADEYSNNKYQVIVEAFDGTDTGTFDVTVEVTNVNEAPIVIFRLEPSGVARLQEDAYNASSERNSAALGRKSLRYVDSVRFSDEDPDRITCSLGGADADDFSIRRSLTRVGGTCYIFFKNATDYEQPTDADESNDYDIIVKLSDPTHTVEKPYKVNITDRNESPDIDEDTVADYTEIEHDSTETPGAVHTFTATEYDGDTVTWSLLGPDAEDFEIGSRTGILTFKQDTNSGPLPNFEDPRDKDFDNHYRITVKATDDDSRVAIFDPRRHGHGDQRGRKAAIHRNPFTRHYAGGKQASQRRAGRLRRARRGRLHDLLDTARGR